MLKEILLKKELKFDLYLIIIDKIKKSDLSTELKNQLEQEIINICLVHNIDFDTKDLYELSNSTLIYMFEHRNKLSLSVLTQVLLTICERCKENLFDLSIAEKIFTVIDQEFGLLIFKEIYHDIPPIDQFKFVFVKYLNYWIKYYSTSLENLFAFKETINHIPKNYVVDLSKMPENSIIYYEDLIQKYKVKKLIYVSKIPIKNPLKIYQETKSIIDKQLFLEHNHSFLEQDLLQIYHSTTSQTIKNLVLQQKNCPETLKLKQVIK